MFVHSKELWWFLINRDVSNDALPTDRLNHRLALCSDTTDLWGTRTRKLGLTLKMVILNIVRQKCLGKKGIELCAQLLQIFKTAWSRLHLNAPCRLMMRRHANEFAVYRGDEFLFDVPDCTLSCDGLCKEIEAMGAWDIPHSLESLMNAIECGDWPHTSIVPLGGEPPEVSRDAHIVMLGFDEEQALILDNLGHYLFVSREELYGFF